MNKSWIQSSTNVAEEHSFYSILTTVRRATIAKYYHSSSPNYRYYFIVVLNVRNLKSRYWLFFFFFIMKDFLYRCSFLSVCLWHFLVCVCSNHFYRDVSSISLETPPKWPHLALSDSSSILSSNSTMSWSET